MKFSLGWTKYPLIVSFGIIVLLQILAHLHFGYRFHYLVIKTAQDLTGLVTGTVIVCGIWLLILKPAAHCFWEVVPFKPKAPQKQHGGKQKGKGRGKKDPHPEEEEEEEDEEEEGEKDKKH